MTSRPPSASSAPAALRPSRSPAAGSAVGAPAVAAGAGADGTVAAGVAVLPPAGEVMVDEVPAGAWVPGPAVGAAARVPAGTGTAEGRGLGAVTRGTDGETGTAVALAVGTGVALGFGRSGGVGQISAGTIPPMGSQGAPAAGNARIRGADASINAAVMV